MSPSQDQLFRHSKALIASSLRRHRRSVRVIFATLQPTNPRKMTETAVDRGRLPPQTGLDHAALVHRHCRLDWTTQSVDYSPQSGTDRGEHWVFEKDSG
jgi:hypothetical protein